MSGSQNVNELEILVKGNYLVSNVVIFKLEVWYVLKRLVSFCLCTCNVYVCFLDKSM